MYDGIMMIFSVLFIVLQLLLINYLLRLERIGCACAMDWRRHFMIFYMILLLVHIFLMAFVSEKTVPLVQTTFTVLGIVNVIVTLQYIARLKREKCECSESFYRDVIMLVAYLNAFLYFFMLIVVLYFLYSLVAYAGETGTSKSNISIKKLFPKKGKKN